MNKKAIGILAAILILIIGTAGFLVYRNYIATEESPVEEQLPAAPEENVSDNSGNPQQEGSLTLLSEDHVLSPVLFFDGSGITYFTTAGKLYQADFDASGTVLSLTGKRELAITPKTDIAKIVWPLAGRNFIAEFETGGKKTWSFFNNDTGVYSDLPSQIESVDWTPEGNKIYYIWAEGGKATLNLSDPDSQNWKFIADMWELDDEIKVSPDGRNIAYYRTSAAATATNPISLTTPDGKVWRTLVTDGYNMGVLWSPDGQKFLFGRRDFTTQKYELWYYNLQTGETKDLGVATIPDKAVWSSDSKTVYAAVPAVGMAGSGQLTQDSIFRLYTDTGEKKEYSGFPTQVDARDLLITKDSSSLLLRNAQNGYLYSLDVSN